MKIVRCDRSGVFFGKIKKQNGQHIVLDNCIRLWYWSGAASLSQMAIDGVKDPGSCKFSVETNSHEVLDAIEIIPCSDKAIKSIQSVKPWRE